MNIIILVVLEHSNDLLKVSDSLGKDSILLLGAVQLALTIAKNVL